MFNNNKYYHFPHCLQLLPVGNSAIASYGKTELEKVIDWLGPNDNSKGFVNPSVMRNEYLSFKMILKITRENH